MKQPRNHPKGQEIGPCSLGTVLGVDDWASRKSFPKEEEICRVIWSSENFSELRGEGENFNGE